MAVQKSQRSKNKRSKKYTINLNKYLSKKFTKNINRNKFNYNYFFI